MGRPLMKAGVLWLQCCGPVTCHRKSLGAGPRGTLNVPLLRNDALLLDSFNVPTPEPSLLLRPTQLRGPWLSQQGLLIWAATALSLRSTRPCPTSTRSWSDHGFHFSTANPRTILLNQPSFEGAVEASTKAHFVAEAVPRGTTLFQ